MDSITSGADWRLSTTLEPDRSNVSTAPTELVVSSEEPDDYEDFYLASQFITGIIIYPIIIIAGITGNVLSILILSHRKMSSSTNVFLSALAVSDTIKLLNDTLYFVLSVLLRTHYTVANRMWGYMYPFSHYIFNQSVCVSSWLTVSVAVERYIAVCHATKARVVCTILRGKIISSLVFLVMSLIALPSGFRYERQLTFNPKTNSTEFIVDLTAFGRSTTVMAGYIWTLNLLRSIIPLIVLIILSTLIIHALQKERVKGKRMSVRNKITMMLIVVIIVFIICVLPDAIMSTVFGFGYVDETNLVKGIREITDSLLCLNAAINFFIYYLCIKGFRDVFGEMFCRKVDGRRYSFYQPVRSGSSTASELGISVRKSGRWRKRDSQLESSALESASVTCSMHHTRRSLGRISHNGNTSNISEAHIEASANNSTQHEDSMAVYQTTL